MKYIYILLALFSANLKAQNIYSADTALRNIYNAQYDRHSNVLAFYLKDKDENKRYHATIGFASIQDTAYSGKLLEILASDVSVKVRRAAAFALGQLYDSSVNKMLIEQWGVQKDISLKLAILESIGKTSCIGNATFFEEFIIDSKDTELCKAYMRASYHAFRRKAMSEKALSLIKSRFSKYNDAFVQAMYKRMFSVAKAEKPVKQVERTLNVVIDTLKQKRYANPYQRIVFLKSTKFKDNKDWLTLYNQESAHAFKTYCLERYFEVAGVLEDQILTELLLSGNVSAISMTCERIRKDSIWYKNPEKYLPILDSANARIIIPRDYEAWLDIYKTQLQLLHMPYDYPNFFNSGYQNPIDWEYVAGIEQNKKVKIRTNKGDIIIQLKVNESPASVANFMKLLDSGYYNNKYFHRMVNDFVVQGGCPRGDGWGSLNWIQRSEFSNELHYQPGSVGLASAGKDSEGVQFFITHTFTAHLDGRYTIFAEVVEGMDVVNKLVVGDSIISISVIEY